jgi:chromosome segregation protein
MARFLKLDRMEISGFKSFYGRTRFDFPDGITAVVGPNGCGKSNIGDAISWVLGEQRASSLRSEKMEDVIFSGSEARRPLGMTEVSLHFKNTTQRSGNGGAGAEEAEGPAGGNGHGAPAETRAADDLQSETGDNGHDPRSTDHAISEGPLAIPCVQEAPEGIDTSGVSGESMPPPDDATKDGEPRRRGARFYLEDLPDDVVVTRRLYRSGESEYALNGRRCRLRDVQDLLALTEIGTRLYSSIEQGKVDLILAAKPKDRRAIIEEAAGILGFKLKRRQSENKLEAAQANLLRISDITGEVEKQIQSLKRQAAKARRYRRLLETLRERRAVLTHQRWVALDAGCRAAGEAIENVRGRHAAAAAEMSRAEADLEALRLEAEQGEEASRKRRDEIHVLDIDLDRMRQRRASGEEQRRELSERISAADREIEELRTRTSGQASRRDSLACDLSAESKQLGRASEAIARIEADRAELVQGIEERERSLEGARSDLMERIDGITELSRLRAALEEQVRLDRTSLQRLTREVAESETEREAVAQRAMEIERRIVSRRLSIEERVSERDALAREEREAGNRFSELQHRAEELKGRASALFERMEALQELERQHAGYARGVAEILNGEAGFAARGLVTARIEVPRGLEKAVTAALGELLEAVLVSGHEEALRGVGHLRREAAGRLAFVLDAETATPEAVDEARAGPGLPAALAARSGVIGILGDRVACSSVVEPVTAILSRTILVQDLALAIDLNRSHPGFAFVTPDGDCVRPDGTILGGDGPELHHGILVRRAEIADFSHQLTEIASVRQSADASLPALRAELDGRREKLGRAASALQEEEKTLLELDVQLRERRVDLDRLDGVLMLLRGDYERLSRDAAQRLQEVESNAAALGDAEALRREREVWIQSAVEAIASQRAAMDGVHRQAVDSKAKLVGGEQRVAALEREVRAVDGTREEMSLRLDRLASERNEWVQRVEMLASQDTALQQALERSMAARAEATARDEAAMAGLAYNRSLLHAREQAVKERRVADEGLRNELQEREVALARLDSDREHLAGSCREELGMTIEELEAQPPAMEEGRDLHSYETEVEEVRTALEGIGPVNLMAIEQYTELEERFEYLSAQKKDLEDSIASLRETIRKINRESRQRFLSAFEAIQAGFQECFSTLFGGGRAELRLQDGEEDVLEAGIEVVAQPPGKRLQSLALLSGGEKALTAVALLFALFRYRPSPFCVLDEVDAPLDEANVERFTRMLQNMRDDTQFILITHNRKSMEAADLLYGVTMEEPGVSKVLPLRFE